MTTYETVEQALDGLRDPQTFAELASAILIDELPELVMGARTGDLGRDAKVQRGVWGEEYVVVQYSLDKKWQTKIDRELGHSFSARSRCSVTSVRCALAARSMAARERLSISFGPR